MSLASANLRGILWMNAGSACFILNDTMTKLAGATMPVGEVLFLRGLVGTALIAAALVAGGLHHQFHRFRHPTVLVRTLGETLAAICYLTALFHMPIGTATAVLMTLPLAVTAAAAFYFRETVGWRRWTAVAIGFLGLLMVVKPGLAGFNAYSLLVLVTVALMVLRDLATRALPADIPSLGVVFVTWVASPVSGLALLPLEDWIAPTPAQLAEIVAAALFLTGGFYALIRAMRAGEISVIAPFRYAMVIWAMLIGFFLWHDVPDAWTFIGTALVVGMGVFTILRERAVARAGQAAEQTA